MALDKQESVNEFDRQRSSFSHCATYFRLTSHFATLRLLQIAACLRVVSIVLLALSAPSLLIADVIADEGMRKALDITSRTQYVKDGQSSQLGYFNTIGIDINKVFSGKHRDFATVNLQLSLWCTKDLPRKPAFFSGRDQCKLVSKVSTVNFSLSGDGKLNFLIGHPEIPYGLEVPVSTNRTLRQLTTGRDIGLKLDWGIGVNGTVGSLNYVSTLGIGSGMEYERDDSFSFAGRIGTATDNQSFLGSPGIGLSWFYGDVQTRAKTISNRWRLGLDSIVFRGPFTLMGQISLGKTDSMDIANGMMEISLTNPDQTLIGYLQLRSFNQNSPTGWQRAFSTVIGTRFTPNSNWSLSFQFERENTTFDHKAKQTVFDLQLRYRI